MLIRHLLYPLSYPPGYPDRNRTDDLRVGPGALPLSYEAVYPAAEHGSATRTAPAGTRRARTRGDWRERGRCAAELEAGIGERERDEIDRISLDRLSTDFSNLYNYLLSSPAKAGAHCAARELHPAWTLTSSPVISWCIRHGSRPSPGWRRMKFEEGQGTARTLPPVIPGTSPEDDGEKKPAGRVAPSRRRHFRPALRRRRPRPRFGRPRGWRNAGPAPARSRPST